VNVLNKQLQIFNKGSSSSFGVGWRDKQLLTIKKTSFLYTHTHIHTHVHAHTQNVNIWPQTWTVSLESSRQQKMDMRFGAWNVKSLYRECSLKTVAS
jgi:hypothetical protein